MKINKTDMFNRTVELKEAIHKVNGESIGYGFDEYFPDIKLDYPEAYALAGLTCINLYNYSKDQNYLKEAEKYAVWLLDNKSPFFEDYSWGLPFKWEEVPANYGYTYTTSWVGIFFAKLNKLTRDYGVVLNSISSWILSRYKKEDRYFSYCDFDKDYNIYNASAKAIYFLAEYNYDKFSNIIIEVIDDLKSKCIHQKYWHYSVKSTIVDFLHEVFIVESLYNVNKFYKDSELEDLLVSSSKYLNSFQRNNGFVYRNDFKESYKSNWTFKGILNKTYGMFEFGLINIKYFKNISEASLWDYSSFLRLNIINDNKSLLENCLNYLDNNLKLNNNLYKYKSVNKNVFIRHNAHLLYSLSLALND